VAVGADGRIHLAFSGNPSTIYYATCTSDCTLPGSWAHVAIAQEGIVYSRTQIRLDPLGRPRVFFFFDKGGNFDEYRYVTCDSDCTTAASWTVSTALVAQNVGDDVPVRSFALDRQGNPAFIYRNIAGGPPRGLYYVRCGGTDCSATASWTVTQLVQDEWSTSAYHGLSLEYDGANVAHVAFRAPTGTNGVFATAYMRCSTTCGDAASWASTYLFQCSASGDLQLRVEDSGRAHLAYSGANGNEQIVYLSCASGCTAPGGWTGITIGSAAHDGARALDLALDAAGRPRIAYARYAGDGVGLARCESGCDDGTATWTFSLPEVLADLETIYPIPPAGGCYTMSAWTREEGERIVVTPGGGLVIVYDATHQQRCGTFDPGTGQTVWQNQTDKELVRVLLR
jgi:hypothetical protein